MAFTTFSGPLRTGTVKEGAGRNTGVAVLSQTATLGLTTSSAFILPAGSQIIDINIDITTLYTSGATMAIGDGTTAAKYVTAITTPAVGRQSITLTAAQIAAWANIGTSDVTITVTMAGTTAVAGDGILTVVYAQKTSAGLSNPTSV
jgi:hypothetical protein